MVSIALKIGAWVQLEKHLLTYSLTYYGPAEVTGLLNFVE